ncbi:chordopoxvirus G3 family protein, partial [Ligilactobacillus murinus]
MEWEELIDSLALNDVLSDPLIASLIGNSERSKLVPGPTSSLFDPTSLTDALVDSLALTEADADSLVLTDALVEALALIEELVDSLALNDMLVLSDKLSDSESESFADSLNSSDS